MKNKDILVESEFFKMRGKNSKDPIWIETYMRAAILRILIRDPIRIFFKMKNCFVPNFW